ncbi:MAG: hypothetical protein ABS95_00155 [Verrucomicrobia bacterium SCN 57-15]|nr:MAG: hypothetical protein ABS95_00155 [Verrucomicrobia bacterium SCN 57-15]
MCCLLKQPQTIFGLPSREAAVLSELDGYLSQMAAALQQCSWDADILEMLDLLPQIFLRLGDSVELGQDSLPVLYRHMYVVFQAYQIQNNPQLEELIQLSPEYSFHLLNWVRAKPKRRTLRPLENFKNAMLLDPHWAIHWQRLQADPVYQTRILEFVHQSREVNPRSAWMWHRIQAPRLAHSAALEDLSRLMPLLLTDPSLCFSIPDFYPECDRKLLFRSAFRHPEYLLAWACRFPGEFDSIVQRELLRSPAWLVEYVHQRKPANAPELLTEARERCGNQWLRPWLELCCDRKG